MALILMCGLPASGKSTIADKLGELLGQGGRTIRIVRDDDEALTVPMNTSSAGENDIGQERPTPNLNMTMTRRDRYKNSTMEKLARAKLRANAERALTSSHSMAVIVDSLNYIKGFRYELFCVAKSCNASYGVIYTLSNIDDCIARDSKRAESGMDSYGSELVLELSKRFEVPNGRNRWDSPLFTMDVSQDRWDNELPAVRSVLDEKLEATFATKQHAMPQIDMLGELDRVTRAAEASLISQLQTGAVVGNSIQVPNASVPVKLQRKPPVAELRNMRRAYLNYSRMHPPSSSISSTDKLADEYVHYINEQLRLRK